MDFHIIQPGRDARYKPELKFCVRATPFTEMMKTKSAYFEALACVSIAAITLTGCGGNGHAPGPDPDPGPGSVDVELIADLADYVGGSLRYVQQFSEGYTVPSASELSQFDALATSLRNQELDTVRNAAGNINFELIRVIDTGANNNELYCLREIALRGQGFYCVDFDAVTTNHVSAPHPLHDSNTNTESVVVMRGTDAKFLSVATTHRCSNSATSSCSGTSSACGASGPYRVSDPAHNVDTYFHRFGVGVYDGSAIARTIQLHGCGSTACPSNGDNGDIVARLSAGTTDNLPDTEFVNVLNTQLNEELTPLQMGSSLSCSQPSADKQLCGTTNVLGRHINGQPDSCQNAAASFDNSRWLHVEQNSNIRRDDGAGDEVTPITLINAINDAIDGG